MINLIPYKEKKSVERIRFVRMVQTIVMAVFILVMISFVLLIPTWITINSRLNITSEQISSLERDGMITSSFDLASMERRANEAQGKLAAAEAVSPIRNISIIQSIVPKGIIVNRLVTEDGSSLEVFGVSESRELLQEFISTLSANEAVSTIDNPVSNFVKNKNGTFKLKVLFK